GLGSEKQNRRWTRSAVSNASPRWPAPSADRPPPQALPRARVSSARNNDQFIITTVNLTPLRWAASLFPILMRPWKAHMLPGPLLFASSIHQERPADVYSIPNNLNLRPCLFEIAALPGASHAKSRFCVFPLRHEYLVRVELHSRFS